MAEKSDMQEVDTCLNLYKELSYAFIHEFGMAARSAVKFTKEILYK